MLMACAIIKLNVDCCENGLLPSCMNGLLFTIATFLNVNVRHSTLTVTHTVSRNNLVETNDTMLRSIKILPPQSYE